MCKNKCDKIMHSTKKHSDTANTHHNACIHFAQIVKILSLKKKVYIPVSHQRNHKPTNNIKCQTVFIISKKKKW